MGTAVDRGVLIEEEYRVIPTHRGGARPFIAEKRDEAARLMEGAGLLFQLFHVLVRHLETVSLVGGELERPRVPGEPVEFLETVDAHRAGGLAPVKVSPMEAGAFYPLAHHDRVAERFASRPVPDAHAGHALVFKRNFLCSQQRNPVSIEAQTLGKAQIRAHGFKRNFLGAAFRDVAVPVFRLDQQPPFFTGGGF